LSIWEKLKTIPGKDNGYDLLHLLKSEFIASFIWNEDQQVFEKEIFFNTSALTHPRCQWRGGGRGGR
jgi:hypothetical protein